MKKFLQIGLFSLVLVFPLMSSARTATVQELQDQIIKISKENQQLKRSLLSCSNISVAPKQIPVPEITNPDTKNTLVQEYNTKFQQFEQQIIDIKNQYYIDKSNVEKSAIPLPFQQGRIDNLTKEANDKINKLQLQEQQLYIDYQSKVNITPMNSTSEEIKTDGFKTVGKGSASA